MSVCALDVEQGQEQQRQTQADAMEVVPKCREEDGQGWGLLHISCWQQQRAHARTM